MTKPDPYKRHFGWCPSDQPSQHTQPWDRYGNCIVCGHHGPLTKNRRLRRHKGVPLR